MAIPFLLMAQEEETKKDTTKKTLFSLGEVVVYANKFPELFKYVTQSVKVINNQSILNFQANTGDILINTGGLFVQKSQQGGSSPIIRGFEASRVLLMIDGVRMNNAIYRAGHLQNIITIDNMILDRLEILYGPSSTLYGSDALGGVINMYTKNPVLSNTKKSMITGSAVVRYSSAIEESRVHVDFNIASKQWASLTSITYGTFGDITQGSRRQSAYPTFGLKNFIVKRYGITDSAYKNPNPNKQTPSYYKQVDVTQKFLFQPKENFQHILNIQISNSSDVHRYDRLTEVDAGTPVFAEWYYGPQLRNMIAYHFSANKLLGFFKEIKLTANYQDNEESRITRRFKNNNKDYRWEQINVFGFNGDAKHYNGKNELHVGIEKYINYVRSTAERVNIVTGLLSRIATRYSDGPTKMSYNAVYAQHTLKINDRWTLNDGLRLSFVKLDALFADTSLMQFPFNKAIQNNLAPTGNVGLIYTTTKNFKLAFLLSSGFRAPNVDDLTKVFDTRTGYVVVPNTYLKPEYTYNAEINFNHYSKKVSFGGSLFYTWFKNAIVVDKFLFNGKDSIIYQNTMSKVFAPQNKAQAYVIGFSIHAAYLLAKNLSADCIYTYTKGKITHDILTVPLDHVPPTYGRVALKYENKIGLAELYTLFNGWKHIADYSTNGEDNLQFATPDGMPSWFTLNIRSSVNLHKNISMQMLIENLLDRNYRYFASGISAPGRNIVFNLKINF